LNYINLAFLTGNEVHGFQLGRYYIIGSSQICYIQFFTNMFIKRKQIFGLDISAPATSNFIYRTNKINRIIQTKKVINNYRKCNTLIVISLKINVYQ